VSTGLVQEGGGCLSDIRPGGIGAPCLRVGWPRRPLKGTPQLCTERNFGVVAQHAPGLSAVRRVEKVPDLLDGITEDNAIDLANGSSQRRHVLKKALSDFRQPDAHPASSVTRRHVFRFRLLKTLSAFGEHAGAAPRASQR
jgi:hypothetical protein